MTMDQRQLQETEWRSRLEFRQPARWADIDAFQLIVSGLIDRIRNLRLRQDMRGGYFANSMPQRFMSSCIHGKTGSTDTRLESSIFVNWYVSVLLLLMRILLIESAPNSTSSLTHSSKTLKHRTLFNHRCMQGGDIIARWSIHLIISM